MKITALDRELPSATLLLGPDVLGMERAARGAVRGHGVVPADRFLIPQLDTMSARHIARWVNVAPFGPFKVFLVCVDGASEQAQNILLKVLEEPPPTVRFILIASERPLPTIVSRCQLVIVPARAERREPDSKVVAQVTAALKAVEAGDLLALDSALAGWGAEHQARLEKFLTETALAYGEAGVPDDARVRWRARRLLGTLGQFGGASSRLAVHAAMVIEMHDREHRD